MSKRVFEKKQRKFILEQNIEHCQKANDLEFANATSSLPWWCWGMRASSITKRVKKVVAVFAATIAIELEKLSVASKKSKFQSSFVSILSKPTDKVELDYCEGGKKYQVRILWKKITFSAQFKT